MAININALGQALDTSWGRSSTPRTASYSVKVRLVGEGTVLASYAAIVNFGSEREMIEMKRRYAEESVNVTKEVIKAIKSNYKDIAGSTLSVKESHSEDSLELVGMSPHNPKKTAYYKRQTVFEVA